MHSVFQNREFLLSFCNTPSIAYSSEEESDFHPACIYKRWFNHIGFQHEIIGYVGGVLHLRLQNIIKYCIVCYIRIYYYIWNIKSLNVTWRILNSRIRFLEQTSCKILFPFIYSLYLVDSECSEVYNKLLYRGYESHVKDLLIGFCWRLSVSLFGWLYFDAYLDNF